MPKYSLPTYDEEAALISRGFKLVAGVDEAGAGCWAGPVFAGAVIFDHDAVSRLNRPDFDWTLIRDSKTLSPAQRQKAAAVIKTTAVAWAVGTASAAEIDRINIRQAAALAMTRAIQALTTAPQFVIIDFFNLPKLGIPNKGILYGDAKSLTIAAASIMAKTERDAHLERLAEQYPGYGLEKHKGYGTKEHQEALRKLGPCAEHRMTYRPVMAVTANVT